MRQFYAITHCLLLYIARSTCFIFMYLLIVCFKCPDILYTGRFELPVTQIIPPNPTRILRKVDSTFVQALKGNIKRDPLAWSSILRCFYQPGDTSSIQGFPERCLHIWSCWRVAQLHSQERASLGEPSQPLLPEFEAVVYCNLTNEQALCLALCHNVNGHFVHSQSYRDLVSAIL